MWASHSFGEERVKDRSAIAKVGKTDTKRYPHSNCALVNALYLPTVSIVLHIMNFTKLHNRKIANMKFLDQEIRASFKYIAVTTIAIKLNQNIYDLSGEYRKESSTSSRIK